MWATMRLSILYLRCREYAARLDVGEDKLLSILYLRCVLWLSWDSFQLTPYLSILYLRCLWLWSGQYMHEFINTFNSLFEMLEGGKLAEVYRIGDTFNSLFEMRRLRSVLCRRA